MYRVRGPTPQAALSRSWGFSPLPSPVWTPVGALSQQPHDSASHQHPGPPGRPRAPRLHWNRATGPDEYAHVCFEGTDPSRWLVHDITASSTYKLSHTNSQKWQKPTRVRARQAETPTVSTSTCLAGWPRQHHAAGRPRSQLTCESRMPSSCCVLRQRRILRFSS